jgi:thiamine biosynthesis protein ThiI
MLKLAPLIGRNKREIIDLARKIGTYEISIEPYGDCCSLMIAKHPETRANRDYIEKCEKNIENGEALAERAAAAAVTCSM